MVAVVLVVIAVLLAGCGDDELLSLDAAVARSEGQSMRMDFTITLSSPQESLSMDGVGAFTARGTKGTFRGDFEVEGESFSDLQMRLDGDDLWMTAPELRAQFPVGKRWFHLRDPTLAQQSVTPAQFVAFIRSADSIEKVGEETVRGRRTTRYRGDVSIKDLVGASGGAPMQHYERQLGSRDFVFPMEVWIDESDRMRRITLRFDEQGVRMDIDATIVAYGVPVDVSPPPKRLVVEG